MKALPSETIQRAARSADLGVMVAAFRVLRLGPIHYRFETQQGARSPEGLGPGPPGLGARPTRGLGPQKPQITIFRKPPGGSLAKAWVSAETAASEVGTWRETKPGYEKGRGFSPAFGNHPTRPPKLADCSGDATAPE